MNRRSFLGSVVAFVAVPFLPSASAAPLVATDALTGISIRFVRQWDLTPYIQPAMSALWAEHDRQLAEMLGPSRF